MSESELLRACGQSRRTASADAGEPCSTRFVVGRARRPAELFRGEPAQHAIRVSRHTRARFAKRSGPSAFDSTAVAPQILAPGIRPPSAEVDGRSLQQRAPRGLGAHSRPGLSPPWFSPRSPQRSLAWLSRGPGIRSDSIFSDRVKMQHAYAGVRADPAAALVDTLERGPALAQCVQDGARHIMAAIAALLAARDHEQSRCSLDHHAPHVPRRSDAGPGAILYLQAEGEEVRSDALQTRRFVLALPSLRITLCGLTLLPVDTHADCLNLNLPLLADSRSHLCARL